MTTDQVLLVLLGVSVVGALTVYAVVLVMIIRGANKFLNNN